MNASFAVAGTGLRIVRKGTIAPAKATPSRVGEARRTRMGEAKGRLPTVRVSKGRTAKEKAKANEKVKTGTYRREVGMRVQEPAAKERAQAKAAAKG